MYYRLTNAEADLLLSIQADLQKKQGAQVVGEECSRLHTKELLRRFGLNVQITKKGVKALWLLRIGM